MKALRNLRVSLRALLSHKARSALAATGIAIGIAAVLLTTALGQGAQTELTRAIGTMGTRLLVVRPAQLKKTPARRQIQGFASSLKFEDFTAINELPDIVAAAPLVEGAVKIETYSGLLATQVIGTTPAYFRAQHLELAQGQLFDDEIQSAPRVVVLGGRIVETLFPDGGAVGRDVRIAGATFQVVGALTKRGAAGDGSDVDNQVFMPLRTAMRRVFDSRSLSAIFVGVRKSEDLDPSEHLIRALLRERHRLDRRANPDDFTIQNQRRSVEAERQITRPLTWFTTGLAALSLFVGGTGILALMWLSVQERRPEIGLRVAVGARRRDIIIQFLTEALLLALAGGTLGITLGTVGTWMIGFTTKWSLHVSPETVLVSLAISSGIGLLFGALPARQAAQLKPARALNLE
jgi:putative ABC transport system permease protein